MIPHCDSELEDSNQSSCGTLRPNMLYHHTKFGYRRFSSWGDIVQMISSEYLNLLVVITEPLPPNLVWWCIIMSQIDFLFKVKVTVTDNIIKILLFNISPELLNLFKITVGLMVHQHEVDCLVKRLDCSVVVKVKVTWLLILLQLQLVW